MKILIVEHDERQRSVMAEALGADGHELIYASSCSDALKKFARVAADLVLMDIALADGDGYQCTQRIRALGGERLAPVILSTSITDPLSLRRFLDCGAADFIDEPSDALLLRAKIGGHAQSWVLYRHLENLREKFYQEVNLAKHMFSALLGRSPAGLRGLQQWIISAGHFCGDLMIQEVSSEGRLYILLGDFTGHGLAAAVGALPASDVFFAMSRKGLPLGQIAAEINRKLNEVLPTGHFLAATLVSMDSERLEMEAWIGGQPPLLLIDNERQVAAQLASRHFPLGVLHPSQFDPATQPMSVQAFRHLLVYSDGLLEACNATGEMFGEARLVEALGGRSAKAEVLQGIKSRLVSFLDGLEPQDDVSVLALELSGVLPVTACRTGKKARQ